jgi:cytochrome c oxidase subunit 2
MSRTILNRLHSAALALFASAFAPAALADWALNMPVGVTEVSKEVYGLHMLILGVCVAIAIVVFGVMIVSIFLHRKSRGVEPAQFYHSTKAEIIWTVIPIIILIAMAVPAAEGLIKVEDTRNADMTVKVTGYQWRWRYDYLDHDIGFYSTLDRESNQARRVNSGTDPFSVENYLLEVDHPLVVPVGAKVRLLLTAADVLHAWWVPDLAVKKDAIPGYINEAWFKADVPGIYRGQCAELCGRDHGFMPVVVHVLERDEYDAWLVEQTTDKVASPENVAATRKL